MNWASIDISYVLSLAIGVIVAYFAWQRAVDNRFSQFDLSVAARFTTLEKSFDGKFSALAIQINTIMMRDVESLQARVHALEADCVGLHKRYHGLANDLNGVGLKVDRLERPHA